MLLSFPPCSPAAVHFALPGSSAMQQRYKPEVSPWSDVAKGPSPASGVPDLWFPYHQTLLRLHPEPKSKVHRTEDTKKSSCRWLRNDTQTQTHTVQMQSCLSSWNMGLGKHHYELGIFLYCSFSSLCQLEPESQCEAAAVCSSTDICRSCSSLEKALLWYSMFLTMGEKVAITGCTYGSSEFSSYLQLKRTHKMACPFTAPISSLYSMVRCSRLT